MKLKVHRESALVAIQLAQSVAGKNKFKPILNDVKVVANGEVQLQATDLEMGLRVSLTGVQVIEPGECMLPAERMVAILRESGDEDMEIEADKDKCRVWGKVGDWKMPAHDPANFPDVFTFDEKQYHDVQSGPLREAIKRVVFAAAEVDPRYATSGIQWEADGKTITLAATDSKRLAVAEVEGTNHGEHSAKTDPSHVMPAKAMRILDSVIADRAEVVSVALKPNEALFKTERAVFATRLISGRFVNWRRILPAEFKSDMVFNAGYLLSAIKQAAIMTDVDHIRTTFEWKPGKLTLQAKGSMMGEAKVEIEAAYQGEKQAMDFSPKLFADMLRIVGAEAMVEFGMNGPDDPVMLRFGKYRFMVMPMGEKEEKKTK